MALTPPNYEQEKKRERLALRNTLDAIYNKAASGIPNLDYQWLLRELAYIKKQLKIK